MREPRAVARAWFDKAEAETDAFDRFVSLWFAFNALYNEYFARDERRAIGDLIHDPAYRLDQSEVERTSAMVCTDPIAMPA